MIRGTSNLLQVRLLRRISWFLGILVIGLFLAFCFLASSFCITLLLAAFLAILVDPVVTYLEDWHVARSVSAGLVIVAGMLFFGFVGYSSYNHVSDLAEMLPQYADKLRNVIKPLNQKFAMVQASAGTLNPDPPSKKIAEVKIRESPTWPSYLIRGVGPIWGAAVILGVVPFLMFFNLIRKEQMNQRLTSLLGDTIDVPYFVKRVTEMVRGFAVGNLIIGSVMAIITVLVLMALKVQGALILGIVSGFLNLIPFLGLLLAALIPAVGALLQFDTAGPFIIIFATVIALHLISANFLIPKIVGSRVSLGPVAATAGILFWGWLWGVIGILLAVPLTALVKIVADCHPGLIHISNLLAADPCAVSPNRETERRPIQDEASGLPDRLPARVRF